MEHTESRRANAIPSAGSGAEPTPSPHRVRVDRPRPGLRNGPGRALCFTRLPPTWPCGRSSMVEPQLPKLIARVRFPSPAPIPGPGAVLLRAPAHAVRPVTANTTPQPRPSRHVMTDTTPWAAGRRRDAIEQHAPCEHHPDAAQLATRGRRQGIPGRAPPSRTGSRTVPPGPELSREVPHSVHRAPTREVERDTAEGHRVRFGGGAASRSTHTESCLSHF